MSSYNNIRKIKYTKTPSDIVSLHEYIIFEDSHAKEKYVVFKFSNNVNQRLLGFKFEVLQYNADRELLEKSTVVHNNFIAEANDLFVPNAKLKINFECESLEVKLESASFDRVVWNNGEFSDNSYRFDSYAETVIKPAVDTQAVEEKSETTKDTKDTKKKKNKLGYCITDISRRNKAVFPAVFNVILCIIVVGLVIFSTFYFKNVTGAFVVDDFVVKEDSGFVTILEYVGKEEDIVIPAMLDEEYVVEKIAKGAFKNSNIKSIEFQARTTFYIETGAFSGCGKLTEVKSSSNSSIIVMEGAFANCKALTSFVVPTAELCSKCFDGTNNIKNLIFDDVVFDVDKGKLLDIFNGLDSITFDNLYPQDFPEAFMQGVRVH